MTQMSSLQNFSENESTRVTIVILCSPSPKHPDVRMISETLNSLRFLDNYSAFQVIISHDFPHPKSSKLTVDSYNLYLKNLREMLAGKPEISIIELKQFGHLTGNIKHSLEYVKTKYVLFVQHDLKFTAQIDLSSCIAAMEIDPRIKHIRFNKNVNQPQVWDKDPIHRERFYKEINIKLPKRDFKLIKTLSWSDNNHLATANYYREIVIPMVGKRKTFPENVLNITSGIFIGLFLGNYIYGGINLPPVIAHLDGRLSSSEPSIKKSRPKKALANNKERIKIGSLRIYYKIKIWFVLILRYKNSRNLRQSQVRMK